MYDDSVDFATRLRSLGNEIRFRVMEGMPHGFMSMAALNSELQPGNQYCVQCLKRVFRTSGVDRRDKVLDGNNESVAAPRFNHRTFKDSLYEAKSGLTVTGAQ